METKKTALVIMAAGIGSRFGGGIKQLEPVDDFGHIIMDYSVHDAIEAGFNKIIFIIRHDIEEDFKNIIGNRTRNLYSRRSRGGLCISGYRCDPGRIRGSGRPYKAVGYGAGRAAKKRM